MTADDALAAVLTERILDVPGVRGVFPQAGALAALASLVPMPGAGPAPEVRVQRSGGEVVVRARLATDARVPSAQVVAAVRRVVADALDGEPCRLRVQVCHVE